MSGTQYQSEVDAMLAKYDILSYRNLFAQPQYSKQNMPKDIDRLIKPFVLTDEERKIKPGLAKIAQSDIHTQIQTIRKDDIGIFQLESLASAPTNPDNFVVIDTLHTISKPTRKSTGTKKRRHPAPAADEPIINDIHEEADSLATVRKKFRSERSSRGRGRGETVGSFTCTTLPPEVLQPILHDLFEEFWNLELEPQLAIPFFSTITRDNCDILGLPGFYEKVMQECTLSNINEKLSQGLYTTPEAFEADFQTMFSNVTTYFDVGTPQHNQAKDMMDLFAIRWAEARERMKA